LLSSISTLTRQYNTTQHNDDTHAHPQDIARGVHERLLAAVPGLHLVRGATLDRFLHHDLVAEEKAREMVGDAAAK
jgi:hypothetical protein